MKLARPAHPDPRDVEEIPRRNRRGLIEARGTRAAEVAARPKFPGEIAGASLKLALIAPEGDRGHINSPAKSPGPH